MINQLNYMLKPFINLCFIIFSSVFSYTAFADIYEYIDEAGVTHYSDAPNNDNNGHDNYVLILKSESLVKSELTASEASADNTLNSSAPTTSPTTDKLILTPP